MLLFSRRSERYIYASDCIELYTWTEICGRDILDHEISLLCSLRRERLAREIVGRGNLCCKTGFLRSAYALYAIFLSAMHFTSRLMLSDSLEYSKLVCARNIVSNIVAHKIRLWSIELHRPLAGRKRKKYSTQFLRLATLWSNFAVLFLSSC